jgi:limonene 1,2-monooxygenase
LIVSKKPIRFGVFTPPITRPNENPTWALHRQLELVEWFDRIGYDEAWFGEHHNGGSELIGSPEIVIGMAAERTKHIMLGTGVTSLPYHHPFLVAERLTMLDHLTRGRVILGCGPGSLAFDAKVMGLDYSQARRRTGESIEAIMALLRSEEPVSMKTDWFELDEAQLHMRPFTYPHFEVTTAGTSSPSGPRLAGKNGISLLTISASSPEGFDALRNTWEIVEAEAKANGQTVDRSGWRLVSFFHLADTEEQARADVRYGLEHLMRYLTTTTPIPLVTDPSDIDRSIDELNATGLMVIGTPGHLVDHLRKFVEQTGGFGGFLGFGHEMADRQATLRSHELVLREVVPEINGTTVRQQSNWGRLAAEGGWGDVVAAAQQKATEAYENDTTSARPRMGIGRGER